MQRLSLFPEAEIEHDPGGKVKLPVPAHWQASAIWGGKNREYRSLLNYRWAEGPIVLGALCNPSVAGEAVLDPTLAKFGQLANRWGFAGFSIVNSCDYRITDSRLLSGIEKPCSAENLPIIQAAAAKAGMILVGHGKLHKSLQPYAAAMVAALRASGKHLHVLAINSDGSPKHPLYCREDTAPVEWVA